MVKKVFVHSKAPQNILSSERGNLRHDPHPPPPKSLGDFGGGREGAIDQHW